MKTLQQIKDEFAQSKGCNDFDSLLEFYELSPEILKCELDELLIIVQQEQQKVIEENARIVEKLVYLNPNKISISRKFNIGSSYYYIDKSSIINENNIIK